jgi:type VI secretion system protein VasJ
LSEALASIVEAITKPVSADAPAGAAARYEPEYEELKAEIEKLGTGGSAAVDWSRVNSLATTILESKSKDLVVATYFALALFQRDGYTGLANGIQAIQALCSTFWDDMFPPLKRKRARVSAIDWLTERATADAKGREPKADEKEQVEACIGRLNDLDTVLDEKFGEDAPAVGDLRGTLKEWLGRMASATPTPSQTATPSPASGATAAAPTASPAAPSGADIDLSTPEGVGRALRQTLTTLRTIANRIRAEDALSPVPYRLTRVAAWLPMAKAPPETGGETRIPGPDNVEATLQRFEELATAEEWAKLLEQAEDRFIRSPAWLDMQRFVHAALVGSGRAGERAADAVRSELAFHLRRHPGLPNLRFAGGEPFADDETHSWIAREVLAGEGGGETAPSGTAVIEELVQEIDEPMERVLEKAGELRKSKKLPDALALLRAATERGANPRERFLRRLATARFLADAKQHRLAVAQLGALDEEIGRFGLEVWDPDLTVQVLSLHLSCLTQLVKKEWKNSEEAEKKAEELFARLGRLDASVAIGLQSR